MAVRAFLAFALVAAVAGQTYRVCIPSGSSAQCQALEIGGSQAACSSVPSRVECALRLARGDADIGYFSEEELLVLAAQYPSELRVLAAVRDASRVSETAAFEAVAVVRSNHSGGLEGLRGGSYCHPGMDVADQRWSPRVLKALEYAAAQSDRCADGTATEGRSADALETEALAGFFSAACRPGPWSPSEADDAQLKSANPALCSLCGDGNSCAAYNLDMGVNVAGVANGNRHVQALECLRQRAAASAAPAVAYVAWLHARDYFTIRNPADAASFSVLCPDGSVQALTSAVLNNATAPCAFVRQPWGAVVASPGVATAALASVRGWWADGAAPATAAGWQAALFQALSGGGASARLVYLDAPIATLNYTSQIRTVASPDSVTGCVAARRWCTVSAPELAKCQWLRASAHVLGLQPTIACVQRASVLECLQDIRESRADLISAGSNYGYIARSHYKLSPIKLVQNALASQARVVAFVKAAADNLTRFENLRGRRACFPEYGGLAYVSFVRAAQERGVVAASQCDYAAALGDFFAAACAPGALDAAHALSEQSSYNASHLCSACRPANSSILVNNTQPFCAWDSSNQFYGNRGALACLAAPDSDVAALNTLDIEAHLSSLNLQASSLRALCRNNSLALAAGVRVDDGCALAHVVDAEILTRREDGLRAALGALLDALEAHFGYSAGAVQLVNFELFSAFDSTSNLLFRDSTIGLTEATEASSHAAAANYMQLFAHLDACSAAPPSTTAPAPAAAARVAGLLAFTALTAVLAQLVQ